MSSFRIRPRFTHTVPLHVDDTRAQILQSLGQHSPDLVVMNFPGFIGLHIPEENRHFWSPRLILGLQSTAEGSTQIDGTYGPEAEVWGLYLYSYMIVGVLGIFSGALGFAQRLVGSEPWGFWVLGAMAANAALLYLSAQLGQKLGAWQTFQLHQAYQRAMGSPAEIK